jgi:hypothetical protein
MLIYLFVNHRGLELRKELRCTQQNKHCRMSHYRNRKPGHIPWYNYNLESGLWSHKDPLLHYKL